MLVSTSRGGGEGGRRSDTETRGPTFASAVSRDFWSCLSFRVSFCPSMNLIPRYLFAFFFSRSILCTSNLFFSRSASDFSSFVR